MITVYAADRTYNFTSIEAAELYAARLRKMGMKVIVLS